MQLSHILYIIPEGNPFYQKRLSLSKFLYAVMSTKQTKNKIFLNIYFYFCILIDLNVLNFKWEAFNCKKKVSKRNELHDWLCFARWRDLYFSFHKFWYYESYIQLLCSIFLYIFLYSNLCIIFILLHFCGTCTWHLHLVLNW